MVPNDPLYGLQRQSLALTGDVEAVWADYSGAGVSVAIYHDGVDYLHPDLAANYDASRHFSHDGVTYDGIHVGHFDNWGTGVAGIIAAVANNAAGSAGIASGASVTSVPVIGYNDFRYATPEIEAAAFRHAAGFDIMQNGWTWRHNFEPDRSALAPGPTAQTLAAIEHVVTHGRGGLGTLVVQATELDGRNANGAAIDASRLTATVAVTDLTGHKEPYSNYGPNLLVAAPTARATADVSGLPGFTPVDHTPLGGPAAATALVSGVAALMLEAAPGLGWRDLQTILALSARETGSDRATGPTGAERFAWQDTGGGTWNGGSMTFNQDYGFGMVDAYAAVRLAEVWPLLHGAAATSANVHRYEAAMGGAPRPVPSNGQDEIVLTIAEAENFRVETIELDLRYRYANSADWTLDLVSPQGVVVPLYDGDRTDRARHELKEGSWSFGVTAFLGTDAAGDWTLRSRNDGDGRFEVTDYTLRLFGSAGTADDVHTFTPDFAARSAENPGRTRLADLDGGRDALNFAAIADRLEVDLSSPTGHVTGLGAPLVIETPGAFETVVTGDGEDFIHGHGGDDALHGRRGADGIAGGTGNDLLDGGRGDDVLGGGDGRDTLRGGDGDDLLHGDTAVAARRDFGGLGIDGPGALHISDAATATPEAPFAIDAAFHVQPDPHVAHSDRFPSVSVSYALPLAQAPGRPPIALSFTLTRAVEMVFDVDATHAQNGWIGLYDGAGRLLASADDSAYPLDPGSLTGFDPHLAVWLAPGAYVLVYGGARDTRGEPGGLAAGTRGTLHVSAASDGMAFALAPPEGRGDDMLDGGAGDDTLFGGEGADLVEGAAGDDLLHGGNGHDTLLGGAGDDTLNGDASEDTLHGGEGDDMLDGGGNNDLLDGEDGADTLRGETGWDLLLGGNDGDLLFGGPGNDTLLGENGDDTLLGGDMDDALDGARGHDDLDGEGGNDTLSGATGNDTLRGNTGWDLLLGGAGWDDLDGGDGNDTLDGGAGFDRMSGGAGDDLLLGGDGDDALDGGAGDDTLEGGSGRDDLAGGAGNDAVTGDGDDDRLYGEVGEDALSGGAGDDTLHGGAGRDTLSGGEGQDRLAGDAAADSLQGGNGDDTLLGGDGADTLQGENGDDRLEGEAGDDRLDGGRGHDRLGGGDGADSLAGSSGNDTLDGGAGTDTLEGEVGWDRLDGGAGDDLIDGASGRDTLHGGTGDDTLRGGSGFDQLEGGDGNDALDGGEDSDTLSGGAGDDRLFGGPGGNDHLTGGPGADVFVFELFFGHDTISDYDPFEPGEVLDMRPVRELAHFTDLSLRHISQVGPDVVIDTLSGHTLTLAGVTLEDLGRDDFLF